MFSADSLGGKRALCDSVFPRTVTRATAVYGGLDGLDREPGVLFSSGRKVRVARKAVVSLP